MSFSASIARNGSYAAIGTGLYSLCQFAILVLFARYEQVVMLGQYALALAISAPIFMLSKYANAVHCRNRYRMRTQFRIVQFDTSFAECDRRGGVVGCYIRNDSGHGNGGASRRPGFGA